MLKARYLLPLVVLLVCFSFVATGCRKGVPVQNPSSAMPVMEKVSDKDIVEAIIRAGAKNNWEIIPIGPQKLEGRLQVRSHTLEVDITYDKKQYAIAYKNSTNLEYQNGRIHPNYNKWVLALDNEIRRSLAALNR